MSLPKISLPLFPITVPSTKQKTKFRPFTVKEEKILLIAQESKDLEQIILSIKQIIENCVEDIDSSQLATFDLEYLFLNIRAKSVANEMNFVIRDPETQEEIELMIDIHDITIHEHDNHTNIIKVNDDIALKMQYPKIEQIKALAEVGEEKQQEALFDIMISCIESVVNGDEVYKLKDFSDKEVSDFIDSLSSITIKEIEKFFNTMPTLRYEKKYKRKDGVEKTFIAEGTETFFI